MAHIILCGKGIKSSQASGPHDLIAQSSASHVLGADKKDDAPVMSSSWKQIRCHLKESRKVMAKKIPRKLHCSGSYCQCSLYFPVCIMSQSKRINFNPAIRGELKQWYYAEHSGRHVQWKTFKTRAISCAGCVDEILLLGLIIINHICIPGTEEQLWSFT